VNGAETAKLLTLIATVDNRSFDNATVAVWGKVLQDVELADAQDAVVSHWRSSDEYLMPIHVLREADAISRARCQLGVAQVLPDIDGREQHAELEHERPGFKVVRYVTVKLAAARKAGLGPATELAQRYTDDARRLYNVRPHPADYHTPCPRAACQCTHTDGCEAGWVEVQPDPDPDPTLWGEQHTRANPDVGRVRPCPNCRPAVAEIIEKGRNRRAVQATLRTRTPSTVVRRAKR